MLFCDITSTGSIDPTERCENEGDRCEDARGSGGHCEKDRDGMLFCDITSTGSIEPDGCQAPGMRCADARGNQGNCDVDGDGMLFCDISTSDRGNGNSPSGSIDPRGGGDGNSPSGSDDHGSPPMDPRTDPNNAGNSPSGSEQVDDHYSNSPSDSEHINDPVNTGIPCPKDYNCESKTGAKAACNDNGGHFDGTKWASRNTWCDACEGGPCEFDHGMNSGSPSPTSDQHHWNNDHPWNSGGNSAPSTNHANINGNHPAPSYNSGPKYPNTGWAPAPNNHMGATGNNDHHYGTPSPTNNQHPWNSGGNSAPSTNHDNNNGNHPAPSYNSGPAPPHTGWAPSPTNNNGFVPSASPTNNNPHHGPSCGSSEDCMSYCENNDIGIESSRCRIPGLLYCDTHHRCQTDPIKLNDQPGRHGASYCGPGTDWEEETQTCVATYNGMLEACEESRGKNWGWTCKNQGKKQNRTPLLRLLLLLNMCS
jgi:hypothetical protein